MARLVRFTEKIGEGEFLNKWFRNRTVVSNKNVIIAFTGPTGSGKTYCALSAGESWYQSQFHHSFPIENVCFSLGAMMDRIISLYEAGKIRKGEYFVLEEAGANFGNLEFQQKISRMFSYILQSFRNMNLILIFTVPVLNMINKNARQLVHAHFITDGIDYKNKIGKMRPYFHQLSQHTGKDYWKYPRARMRGKVRKIQHLKFSIPPEHLVEEYEKKKAKFVIGLGKEFVEEYKRIEEDKIVKDARKELTSVQLQVLTLLNKGYDVPQIAEIRKCSKSAIYEAIKLIEKKGYRIEKIENSIRNVPFQVRKAVLATA